MIALALRGVRVVSRFLASHIPAHVLALLSGIVVVWMLPASEYAIYTLASGLIAIGNVSSDPGASQAVMALASKERNNKSAVTLLIEACQLFRRRILVVSSAAILLAGYVLLHRTGVSESSLAIVLLLVLATLVAQRRLSIFNSLFYVYGNTGAIFRTMTWSSGARFVLVLLVVTSFPVAWVALAINVVGAAIQDILANRLANSYLGSPQRDGVNEALRQIRGFVWPLLPGVAYFLIHSQITVVFLAWMGRTTDVAEIGALGRIWQVFSILAFLNGLILPYFARLESLEVFRRRSLALISLWVGFSSLVLLSAHFWPQPWLLILGPNYGHLEYLLPLCISAAMATATGASMYSVVLATGVTRFQALQIPFGLGAQVLVAYVTQLKTVGDALLLSAAPFFSNLILQLLLVVAARSLLFRRGNLVP